jgi:hypothetical protein
MIRPLNRPMITVSIMLATIMQTLGGTIANVALPHMQGVIDPGGAQQSLESNTYPRRCSDSRRTQYRSA